jgi:hypothetical protein
MYDLDDDNCVGFPDFSYFAADFQQSVDDPNSTYGHACDHDHSGYIDFGDFSYFAGGFFHTSTDVRRLAYAPNFPGAWRGQTVRLEATEQPGGNAAVLTEEQVLPVFDAALERIESSEGEQVTEILRTVDVEIMDLPGDLLGRASEQIVQIDIDAAGYGWFVDTTPRDNVEFFHNTHPGDLIATPGSLAQDRADLLTVVLHELGHVLGHDHADEGIMDDTLPLGTRRLPLEDFDRVLPSEGLQAGVIDEVFASFGSL